MNWKILGFFIVVIGLIDVRNCDDDEDDVFVTSDEEVPVFEEEVVYSSPTPAGDVYLAEHFDDLNRFKNTWIVSKAKKEDTEDAIAKYDGQWTLEAPVKDGLRGDTGLVLKSKAKHSAISSRLNRVFEFKDKPLVVQYEVIFQEGQECGGAYLKLLSEDPKTGELGQFHDKTPYTIMFGPDKCGNDHKLHFIFRHRNPLNGTLSEKHSKKPSDRLEEPFKDKQPHLYTLVLKSDNTYQVSLDKKVVIEGNLLLDFTPAVNPPAEVEDPNDQKPQDWDEREKIPDPQAVKPDDWDETAPSQIADTSAVKPNGWLDDEPVMISDPSAEKPDDWDTDMDGEWEAPLVNNPLCDAVPGCGEWKSPMIANPHYKGKWHAPLVSNPNYKGKWRPKIIANPDYFNDQHPFQMTPITAVGFELWSMSNMILFDNIIVTDDPAVAEQWASTTFDLKRRKLDKQAESMISRLISYTNEQPWLWAVYLLVIGLPVVLILVFCCGPSGQEKEEFLKSAETKKTDAVSPDDMEEINIEEEIEEVEKVDKASKSELDQPKEEKNVSDDKVQEETAAVGDASHSPKKRRPRVE